MTAASDPESNIHAGWLLFFIVIAVTAFIDLALVTGCARNEKDESKRPLGMPLFVRQLIFWIISGAIFNMIVWKMMGVAAAGNWLYGYFIEYLLSIDNLFIFQVVFKSYSTPATHIDRALFWGIAIAVGLRIIFYTVGTGILGFGFIARAIFGLALIYSGIKTLRTEDDDDDDPRNNPVVRSITKILPVHDSYCDEPCFFTRVPTVPPNAEQASSELPPATIGNAEDLQQPNHAEADKTGTGGTADCTSGDGTGPTDMEMARTDTSRSEHGKNAYAKANSSTELDPKEPNGSGSITVKHSLKVTPLFLVVLTIGIIDLIFAVDSVTAKISSVHGVSLDMNLFLNVTSSAFAMFVLRSLYSILDMLASVFRFLSCGVGAVLIFIGVKLMAQGYIEVGMAVSSSIIVGILLLSILASAVWPQKEVEETIPEI